MLRALMRFNVPATVRVKEWKVFSNFLTTQHSSKLSDKVVTAKIQLTALELQDDVIADDRSDPFWQYIQKDQKQRERIAFYWFSRMFEWLTSNFATPAWIITTLFIHTITRKAAVLTPARRQLDQERIGDHCLQQTGISMKNLQKILMSELDTAGLASAARAQASKQLPIAEVVSHVSHADQSNPSPKEAGKFVRDVAACSRKQPQQARCVSKTSRRVSDCTSLKWWSNITQFVYGKDDKR